MQRAIGVNVTEGDVKARAGDAGGGSSSAGSGTAPTRTDLSGLDDALRRSGGTAEVVVPVVAEELRVDRQSVETGRVRVTKAVRERQQVVDEPTRTEHVTVERVPVNRVVDGPVAPRQEGDTLILPVLEEVVVVERKLVLKEEVRITKHVSETREPQTVTLRSEDVRIDRIPAGPGESGT